MITPDRPFWLKRWPKWSPRRTAWWAVGLTVLALVGVVLWWSARPEGPVGPHEGAAAVGQGTPAYQGGVFGPGGQAPALAVPSVLPDGRPSDFSPQEWTALKDAMSKTAKPEAELQRVVAYLRFQKAFGAWQGLRESSDTARRQQLASQLVAQIPERLRQGEVTLGEALVLEAALWTDLEPDEARRKVRLEEVQVVLAGAAPQPDAAQQSHEAALLAEYKRREAAIVLEYQSRPEAQRDQAWLEAQLDAARRSVYGAN